MWSICPPPSDDLLLVMELNTAICCNSFDEYIAHLGKIHNRFPLTMAGASAAASSPDEA